MRCDNAACNRWAWAPALLLSGCAGYAPMLPQGQAQTGDRNGPVTVQIYQGVQRFGGPPGADGKLAETITVTVTAPASADGSVQGSATQGAAQDGSELGPADQRPAAALEIPLTLP